MKTFLLSSIGSKARPGLGWAAAAAAGLVSVYTGIASAAPPSESGPAPSVDHAALVARIRPPEPLELPVEYPPGAQGDASVILHVVVDTSGRVVDGQVVSGDEPFASAARAAIGRFRFVPAEREGRPVAAKIRVEVVFRAPEGQIADPAAAAGSSAAEAAPASPAPSTAAQPTPPSGRTPAVVPSVPTAGSEGEPGSGPAPASQAPTPATSEGTVEVHVLGERDAPDAESLSRAEARMIPGAFGDPLRAIEVMPGVAPAISGLPYFFVRGAPPGNVGYFVDGVRVPMLWHAFVGPSVLNPATIEKVTLHRGGYPARYGRYAGAIVTADTLVPYGDYSGEASLRVVDAGIMQTVPLSSEGRSAALVSGRYAYLGPVISSLASDVELGYWDYQVSSRFDLGPNDRIGLLALGASDTLEASDYSSLVRYHRLDPRYEHDFSEDSHLRVAVALGLDRTGSENGSVSDRLVAPRVELHQRFGDTLAVRVGVDMSFDDYELDVGENLRYRTIQMLEGVGATRSERTFGSYVDLTWRPLPRVWVSPGVRADIFYSEGVTESGVDPRIAARMEVNDTVAFEHTLGLAHQSASFVPGIPGAAVTNIQGGLQRSVQASSSVEFRLPSESFLSVTAFDAIYLNLADPLGTEHEFSLDAAQLTARVRGNAYGLEVFFKRPLLDRVGGMLAYTLSRSNRSYGRISTLSSLDRTHVASATIVFDVGRDWQLGARNSLLSGLPTRWNTNDGPIFDGDERTTPFFRMDLRAEKRYRLGEYTSLSVVAELLNATLSREVTERSCNDTGCRESGVGPIVVPNVGAELRY